MDIWTEGTYSIVYATLSPTVETLQNTPIMQTLPKIFSYRTVRIPWIIIQIFETITVLSITKKTIQQAWTNWKYCP